MFSNRRYLNREIFNKAYDTESIFFLNYHYVYFYTIVLKPVKQCLTDFSTIG